MSPRKEKFFLRQNPFPLGKTIRAYSFNKFRCDIRAALNVALLDFPQGMAYAMIAGLPAQMGIFCSSISAILGPFFSSSRFAMFGPTNATAVTLMSAFLLLEYTKAQMIVVMPILLFMIGLFMIAASFLKVSTTIQYISRSVIAGYITAAGILIIVNQVKSVFNLHLNPTTTFANTVIELCHVLWRHPLGKANWESLFCAAITAALYYGLRWKKMKTGTVFITLLTVASTDAILRYFGIHPAFDHLAPISFSDWHITFPKTDFEGISKLVSVAFSIAILAILETSSISKTLAAKSGDMVDINQQVFSMGIVNIANAFGSGMPASASPTRSMLNYDSGAKTRLSSVYSAILLLIGLFFIGSFIQFLPKPALGAMIITVGISLFNIRQIKTIIRSTRSDAIVFATTLLSALFFSLDIAIYMGSALSIVLFLKKVSRPQIVEYDFNDAGHLLEKKPESQRAIPSISIVHVEGDLFFGSTDIFLQAARKIVEDPTIKVVILRLKNAHHLDASVALAISDLIRFAREQGDDIIVSGAHKDVTRVFVKSGLMKVLGEANFFKHDPNNLNLSTKHALLRAQEIIGTKNAEIKLFTHEHVKEE